MSRGRVALVLLSLSGPAAAGPADALDEYVRLQVGSFTSEAQSRQDARYDVATWHIVEIWPGDDAGARWLYTESWIGEAPAPYLQRVSRLTVEPDGTVLARRYRFPDAVRVVGAWQATRRFDALPRAELIALDGCDAVIARTGPARFEGGTVGARCRNDYRGAAYAVSQSVLTPEEMLNWDRGFDVNGNQVWGPSAGGYRFRRVGERDACVDPVRMLVFGEIRDRQAFGAYVGALARSGLYARNGGYYEAISPALEVIEGQPPSGRGVIIARFPCLAAAQRFWRSTEYAEIRKLREGLADFEVLVLPVPRIPT